MRIDKQIGFMFLNLMMLYKKRRALQERRQRRWCVRPVNIDRGISGYYVCSFLKIKNMDEQHFFIHTRMTKSLFNVLLTLVENTLSKPNQLILPEERLSITIL